MLATEVAPFVSSMSTPLKNTSVTARVDQQFGPMHNASIVYQGGRLINLRQFGGGNRLADVFAGPPAQFRRALVFQHAGAF